MPSSTAVSKAPKPTWKQLVRTQNRESMTQQQKQKQSEKLDYELLNATIFNNIKPRIMKKNKKYHDTKRFDDIFEKNIRQRKKRTNSNNAASASAAAVSSSSKRRRSTNHRNDRSIHERLDFDTKGYPSEYLKIGTKGGSSSSSGGSSSGGGYYTLEPTIFRKSKKPLTPCDDIRDVKKCRDRMFYPHDACAIIRTSEIVNDDHPDFVNVPKRTLAYRANSMKYNGHGKVSCLPRYYNRFNERDVGRAFEFSYADRKKAQRLSKYEKKMYDYHNILIKKFELANRIKKNNDKIKDMYKSSNNADEKERLHLLYHKESDRLDNLADEIDNLLHKSKAIEATIVNNVRVKDTIYYNQIPDLVFNTKAGHIHQQIDKNKTLPTAAAADTSKRRNPKRSNSKRSNPKRNHP